MDFNEATLDFIRRHADDDVSALALQAGKHPGVDMQAALAQIAGRQRMQAKVPSWARQEGIVYPPQLPLEQCSSEETARHKAEIVEQGDGERQRLVDLTGGFGVDCAFLSRLFRTTAYVERQEELCRAARHNFPLLGLTSIEVHHADSTEFLRQMPPADMIFIDPARRDSRGGKTVAIADCEPDVGALEPLLLAKAERVLVKLSPMLDIFLAVHSLQHVQAVHIVSVVGECKELLLVLDRGTTLPADEVPIHCTNLLSGQPDFSFTRRQEQASPCPLAPAVGAYLYEPNASILKAGAFRSLAYIYKVEKLHPNSHLYTSDEFVPHFPGRKFRVEACCGFAKKDIALLLGTDRKANLTVRNFPATVAELRKRLRLHEGGDRYLFATTLADDRKVLIGCRTAADTASHH